MKSTIDVYMCDFCGGEITKFPTNNESGLPSGHAYTNHIWNYQTLDVDNNTVVFCKGCCMVLHSAIEFGVVDIHSAIDNKMRFNAGFRLYKDKWIPLSLYELKIEKDLKENA